MKVYDGGVLQGEIRSIRFIGEPSPAIGGDVLNVFHQFAASTWTNGPEPTGHWMVHDPANARIVFGSLHRDVLTVWTDRPFAVA